MLVLALDTTTRQGSIALERDGALLATYAGDAETTHGERLPGDVLRVLGGQSLRVADVDVFAVASGPGSFTGLRIGIAAMQGFALANAKPLVGVSALDAICETAGRGADLIVWMDAQRGQVFSATYTGGAAPRQPIVERPADILSRWQREGRHPRVFAGDGALAYRDLILHADSQAHIVEPLGPLAPAIARLAAAHLREGGSAAPDEIRPLYIRRSDAELARDRKADRAGCSEPA